MQVDLEQNVEISDCQLQQERLSQELMAIGKRCADHIQQPAVAIEHGDMLYGADGLPL